LEYILVFLEYIFEGYYVDIAVAAVVVVDGWE